MTILNSSNGDFSIYSIDEVLKALKYPPGISRKEKRRIQKEWIKERFEVPHNKIINQFITDGTMINDHNHGISKSYFLVNEKGILAFFNIRLEIVKIDKLDNSLKKKMIPKGQSPKNTTEIVTFLIEQIAKNNKIKNNSIHADDIISSAISVIKQASRLLGGVLITLNSIMPVNNPKCVLNKYKNIGFTEFGETILPKSQKKDSSHDRSVKYQAMFLRITDEVKTDLQYIAS